MPRNTAGSKKATKDPNAPKRPLSAFFLFSQDERPDIKKKNPSMSVGDISKEIGARWKKASDDVKKRYEQKAAVEKQKYEARLSEYKKSGGGSSPAKGGASKGASKAAASKKSPKKPATKKSAKSKSSEEDNDEDDDDDDEGQDP